MEALIKEQYWSRAQVLAHIVMGHPYPAKQERLNRIDAWLSDRDRKPKPTDSDAVAKRLDLFDSEASKTLPVWSDPTLELSPVVWIWFAYGRASAAIAPKFRQALEAWIAQLHLSGQLAIALFRTSPLGKGKLSLQDGLHDPSRGVPLPTLLTRHFEPRYAQPPWRGRILAVAAPRPRATRRRSSSHSPDSPQCEAHLQDALHALARKSTKIKLLEASSGSQRFLTPDWNRTELLERLKAGPSGKPLTPYSNSTLLRSLSRLVVSRMGRPPRPATSRTVKR